MAYSRFRTPTQFVVLAPVRLAAPSIFRNLVADNRRYDHLLAEMQRFRGRIYTGDGAIPAEELTPDGRHRVPVDEESWNVLSLDQQGHIVACLRCLDEKEATVFDDLWIRHAAPAKCPLTRSRFRSAVEREMARAREAGTAFSEVGGWAVAENYRWTPEALRIILAAYSLGELFGGRCGVATATFRHSSAMILRRIGLTSIVAEDQEFGPYYDPYYRCQMEVLGFDSSRPNPKYRDLVSEISYLLSGAPVFGRENVVPSMKRMPRVFERLEPTFVPAGV